jgi:AraC-like DNA-binding protein
LAQHNNHADINLPGGTRFFNYDIQMIIAPLHNWTFIVYSFIYLHQQKKKNLIRSKVSRIIRGVRWIIVFMMFPVLLQILFATLKSPQSFDLSFQDSTISSDIMYLSTLFLPVSFFVFPSWLYGSGSSSSILDKLKEIWYTIARVSTDGISAKPEKSADLDRIVQYMEMKKPYLNANFSIHDVSRELNIPHLRVSNSFNKQLETSFPEYRNKLRVAYAVNLLQENAHFQMSIEGIAFQSGFKNKSSFYAAFRTVYQMPPTAWISTHLA